MKALCWMGSSKVEVHNVSDPTILNPHDAIIKITRTAFADRICISSMDSSRPWKKATFSATSSWGSSKKSGNDVTNLAAGRSRSGALHHRMRELRVL